MSPRITTFLDYDYNYSTTDLPHLSNRISTKTYVGNISIGRRSIIGRETRNSLESDELLSTAPVDTIEVLDMTGVVL